MFVGLFLFNAATAVVPTAIKGAQKLNTVIEHVRMIKDHIILNQQAVLEPEELFTYRHSADGDEVRWALSQGLTRARTLKGNCKECGARVASELYHAVNLQMVLTQAEYEEMATSKDAKRVRHLVGVGRERAVRWREGRSAKVLGLETCSKCGAAKTASDTE